MLILLQFGINSTTTLIVLAKGVFKNNCTGKFLVGTEVLYESQRTNVYV